MAKMSSWASISIAQWILRLSTSARSMRRTFAGNRVSGLASIRAARDESAVIHALAALREAASSGQGSLLDFSIEAMAVRSTVGEVSSALADVFQRHRADAYSIDSVPSVETQDRRVPAIREKIARFVERKGRAPRICSRSSARTAMIGA